MCFFWFVLSSRVFSVPYIGHQYLTDRHIFPHDPEDCHNTHTHTRSTCTHAQILQSDMQVHLSALSPFKSVWRRNTYVRAYVCVRVCVCVFRERERILLALCKLYVCGHAINSPSWLMGNSAVLCSSAAPAVIYRDSQYSRHHQCSFHWWMEKHELSHPLPLTPQHMTYCHIEALIQPQLSGRFTVIAFKSCFTPGKVAWLQYAFLHFLFFTQF